MLEHEINIRTMPACTIIPVLVYPDVETAIQWLYQNFGFKERWRAGNQRAQLAYGDGVIAITSHNPDISGKTAST
jgi:hypothetical protein